MKFFPYLSYFLYIAYHWNIPLAWFTIQHEIKGEKKYGLNTSGLHDLKNLSIKGEIAHAEIYQGSNYFLLEKVFEFLDENIKVKKNLIDFGCGKGRVLIVASFYNFDKITGVDFAKELYDEATKNIHNVQEKFPEKHIGVVYTNALDYKIEDDTNIFFFFNPFDEVIMLKVVKNILQSLKQRRRVIYIVYVNPVHKEIFMSAGFKEIYHFEKLQYIQASVMKL